MLSSVMLAGVLGVFALSVVSGICQVVAGTGAYMIFALGWMLAGALGACDGSMKDVAGFIIFFEMGLACVVWSLRRHVNPRLVLVILVPWVMLDVLGTTLLIQQDQSPWLKRSFGVLLFIVLFFDAFEQRRQQRAQLAAPCSSPDQQKIEPGAVRQSDEVTEGVEKKLPKSAENPSANEQCRVIGDDAAKQKLPPECRADTPADEEAGISEEVGLKLVEPPTFDLSKRENLSWALFLGIAGGLLKGVYAVPMPALCAFVLFTGIDKDMWRCNITVVQLSSMPMKAWYFFVVRSQFQAFRAWQYLAVFAGVFVALPAGNLIAKSISKEDFQNVIRVLTFTGALSMCTAETPYQLSVAALALLLSATVASCCGYRRRQVPHIVQGGSGARELRQKQKLRTEEGAGLCAAPPTVAVIAEPHTERL